MGDPAVSIAYKVTIDGFIPLGIWTKIEGLGFEYQVTEYREGGVNGYTHKILGPCKYTNVRLSRPVDSTSGLLMLWLQSNMIAVLPQTMAISACTASGAEIATWNLAGVVPIKWSGPSLDV
ncbi:MAG: phage tail protein, partial [Chloroflexi bacterium]|nr:phage tail protein [Chloroflexota bacterium]